MNFYNPPPPGDRIYFHTCVTGTAVLCDLDYQLLFFMMVRRTHFLFKNTDGEVHLFQHGTKPSRLLTFYYIYALWLRITSELSTQFTTAIRRHSEALIDFQAVFSNQRS